jgi:hypothetical protein
MSEKKENRVLYVCTAKGCDFSDAGVGVDEKGNPRIRMVPDGKGGTNPTFDSPSYGTVSAEEGQKAVCPVCGAVCTEEENGEHKALRVASPRIEALMEKIRLLRNVLKGGQYTWTEASLARLRQTVYAQHDALQAEIDRTEERLKSPTGRRTDRKAATKTLKVPFAL